jgi:hypothetical protein
MKLLFKNNHYEVIETSPPQVFLMGAEPYTVIVYTLEGKLNLENVTKLSLHKE